MRPAVVVVGDALLDVDVVGTVTRRVPDTDAPVLAERWRSNRPGGAALAAELAARDGADVTLVTVLPDDDAGRRLRELLHPAVRVVTLPATGATASKIRLLDAGTGDRPTVLARHDTGGETVRVGLVPPAAVAALVAADAVLVSDYGRGVAAAGPLRGVLAGLDPRVPLVWDPHPRGTAPVPARRLVVTPNATEAAATLGLPATADLDEQARRARRLAVLWGGTVLATVGELGALLADPELGCDHLPVDRVDGDACGAGDRVASRLAVLLGRGEVTSGAAREAIAAASGFVAAGGAGGLERATAERRPVVVATGGCFDLLHAGHLATLQAARACGDRLVVLLNSDASVRRGKGPDRPWQSAADRRRLLAGLRCVDEVRVFDEDTPERALDRLRPDIWVKGGDYAADDLPETPLVRSWGGRVVTVPFVPGRSSTGLMQLAGS